jgi:nucleotide-binding universal stress UspA family protein
VYETVLWATDASPIADGALAEAVRLLQPGGRLIAFHCEERFLGDPHQGQPTCTDETHVREKLTGQLEELKADGIDADLVIEPTHHNTAGEIAKAAEVHGADVIVCGTRGFGVVAGAIAGSVAMRLPHLASCPVIVVSERAAARRAPAAR